MRHVTKQNMLYSINNNIMPTQDSLIIWKNVERFKMHEFQREEFVKKNLLGQTYTFRFKISGIQIDHFYVFIGHTAFPESDMVRFRFNYDTSFNSKVHSLNNGDFIECSGILIREGFLSDYGFLIQLSEIIKVDSPQIKSSTSNSSCFIATACYGDYDAPEVLVLRDYRDNVLLKTFFGRIAVDAYYLISPPIAKALYKSESIKDFVRKNILAPIVSKIKQNK
jgi:hypothetical protein